MDTKLIRFVSSGWRFLELDETQASASLTDVYEETFGQRPDFSGGGDAVTGHHGETPNPRERILLVARTASGDAVRQAIRLLIAKYDLDRVRLMQALPTGPDFDWVAARAPEVPYDPDAVVAWPREEREIFDRIVIEFVDQPGRFVHKDRAHARVAWKFPAETVEDALVFPMVEAAHAWLDRQVIGERFQLRWRSVAISEADQRERASADEAR